MVKHTNQFPLPTAFVGLKAAEHVHSWAEEGEGHALCHECGAARFVKMTEDGYRYTEMLEPVRVKHALAFCGGCKGLLVLCSACARTCHRDAEKGLANLNNYRCKKCCACDESEEIVMDVAGKKRLDVGVSYDFDRDVFVTREELVDDIPF